MGLIDYLGRITVPSCEGIEIKKPKKILVIRLDHIGDVLMTTPFIRSLKKHFPCATITMVVKKLTFDTVIHNPYIDEIEVYNSSWTIPKIEGNTKQGMMDFIRLFLKLRKEKYDVAFDLKGDFRNILIMYLSGAKRRIGYGIRGGGFMLTDVVNYNAEEHEIDKNLSLLKPLNLSSTIQEPEIFVSEEDEEAVRSILREIGIQKTRLMIGIHAGGASLYKRWPEEKFVKLIKLLKREGEAQILIFGGHYERNVISKIRRKIRENGVFIMPELTLCQMASAFARCHAVICNDSGAMHVAIAAKTPVIAIFGPTFADRFGPKDLKRNRVVCSRMDCSPCWNPDTSIGCRERTCLNNVTVNEVFEAVKEAVQS